MLLMHLVTVTGRLNARYKKLIVMILLLLTRDYTRAMAHVLLGVFPLVNYAQGSGVECN